MRYLFTAVILIAGTSAQAAEPYEGSWAEQTAYCTSPADSNIRISGKMYYAHESACRITKADKSAGTYALFIACAGEGEKWKDAVVVVPQGNRMLVGGTSGKPLIRCP